MDCRDKINADQQYDPFKRFENPEICYARIIKYLNREILKEINLHQNNIPSGYRNPYLMPRQVFENYTTNKTKYNIWDISLYGLYLEASFSGFCFVEISNDYKSHIKNGYFYSQSLNKIRKTGGCRNVIILKDNNNFYHKNYVILINGSEDFIYKKTIEKLISNKTPYGDIVAHTNFHIETVGTNLDQTTFKHLAYKRAFEVMKNQWWNK